MVQEGEVGTHCPRDEVAFNFDLPENRGVLSHGTQMRQPCPLRRRYSLHVKESMKYVDETFGQPWSRYALLRRRHPGLCGQGMSASHTPMTVNRIIVHVYGPSLPPLAWPYSHDSQPHTRPKRESLIQENRGCGRTGHHVFLRS